MVFFLPKTFLGWWSKYFYFYFSFWSKHIRRVRQKFSTISDESGGSLFHLNDNLSGLRKDTIKFKFFSSIMHYIGYLLIKKIASPTSQFWKRFKLPETISSYKRAWQCTISCLFLNRPLTILTTISQWTIYRANKQL